MLKQLFNLINRVTYFGIEHDDTYLERFRKRVLNRAFTIIAGGCLLIVSNALISGNQINPLQPLIIGLIALGSLFLTYLNYFKLARFILSVFLPSMFLYEIMQYGSDLKLDYTISFFIVLVFTMYDRGWPLVVNMLYLIFLQGFSYYYTANYPSPYADFVDPYDSITIIAFTTIGLLVLIFKFIRANRDFQQQQEAINRELLAKTKELQRSNEFLESYTYIASHDLKSPLRNITSFSDLILKKLKDQKDEDIRDYLQYLKAEVIQINAVVEGIIENAKDNHSNLTYEKVDTQAIVSSIENKLHHRLQNINGCIKYKDLPVIQADQRMITKVLLNLIDNGLKYNRSESPTVCISHQLTDQHHEFSVTDNGIGIQDIYSADIFKMFKKLHAHHEFTGSGVGLALCKKIIELHQGKIWLEKKEDPGSLFKFTIPKNSP